MGSGVVVSVQWERRKANNVYRLRSLVAVDITRSRMAIHRPIAACLILGESIVGNGESVKKLVAVAASPPERITIHISNSQPFSPISLREKKKKVL